MLKCFSRRFTEFSQRREEKEIQQLDKSRKIVCDNCDCKNMLRTSMLSYIAHRISAVSDTFILEINTL